MYQVSCSFVKNLYSTFYKALMLGYQIFNTLHGSDTLILKNQSLEILFTVRKYLNFLINYHLNDRNYLKLAYTITPTIVNFLRTFYDDLDILKIQVLNSILTELNITGLNLCLFSNINFFSFNNINTLDLVNLEELDNSFVKLVQLSYDDFDLNILNNRNDSMLQNIMFYDVDFLYKKIFRKSEVYKWYENIVRFGKAKLNRLNIYTTM